MVTGENEPIKRDGMTYVGELWPWFPPLPDPERIKWMPVDGGFVIVHPDRPPMECVHGVLSYVQFKVFPGF